MYLYDFAFSSNEDSSHVTLFFLYKDTFLCNSTLIFLLKYFILFNLFFMLLNRLRDISEESVVPPAQPRRRSNSLPIPQIEISLYQGSGSKDSPSNSSSKDFIEIPEPAIATIINDTLVQQQKSIEKPDDSLSANGTRRTSERKKRVKMADLRTLIETKILSKSDRGLEKIGVGNNNVKCYITQ